MTDTPHLALPLLAAAQAQKHVTHNEALACLDALVQLAVIERGRNAPPVAPTAGDRYLVGDAPSGAFAGQAGRIAWFDAGAWRFLQPRVGWVAYVAADDAIAVHDGAAWRDLGGFLRELGAVESLGVGTAPDALNRLAAKLNAALFTARTMAEGGTGDLRFVLNREGAADTVSQLYQTGYGGRAETGLIGDDDFTIKVSPDGAAWFEALRLAAASGDLTAGRASLSHAAGSTLSVGSGVDGACVVLKRSGVAVGSIAVSATGTTYNTTSDGRLKTDFQPVEEAGAVIDALRVGSFRWAGAPDGTRSLGLLAQEAAAVVPDAVLPGDDDPAARPGDPGFRAWSLDYARLVPHLLAETQALRRRVATLEARLR